jgi:hypothetical protein
MEYGRVSKLRVPLFKSLRWDLIVELIDEAATMFFFFPSEKCDRERKKNIVTASNIGDLIPGDMIA